MKRLTDSEFRPPFTERWFLWGMPLSGKSSLGKKLKKIVSFPVIDLDKEIEIQTGKSIPALFEDRGEAAFRKLESEVLERLTVQNQSFFMITGGGTPCQVSNLDLMLQNGTCLFLDTQLSVLVERLSSVSEHQRPLLMHQPEERLKQLYAERYPVYQMAHAYCNSEAEALMYFKKEIE